MKSALFAILFMVPALAWAKPEPADYTLTVHVHSSRLVLECDSILGRSDCGKSLHLNVAIDGKKYELHADHNYLLRLGDYKAKLLPDDDLSTNDNPPAEYEYRRKYEFLFPDGKTRKFTVVGESE